MNSITFIAILILSIAVMLLGVAVVCNNRENEINEDKDMDKQTIVRDIKREVGN